MAAFGDVYKENIQKAEQGVAYAQYNVGWAYANGAGAEKDMVKAAQWYQKAADQGYAEAEFNLGWMYTNGVGVEQNNEKAITLYKQSAGNGYALAQYALGWSYQHGMGGIKQDPLLARQWLTKAAQQGHQNAKDALASMGPDDQSMDENYEIQPPPPPPPAPAPYLPVSQQENTHTHDTDVEACTTQVQAFPTSFPRATHTYYPKQLIAACNTEPGRALVSSFKNQLQHEENNVEASWMRGILAGAVGTVGIIVLLLLLYRWSKNPQTSEKIRFINSESIKNAIKEENCDLLKRLLESNLDLQGWSFVDIDLEDLEPFTKQDLQDKGIIVELDELLQTSKNILASESTIPADYINRLCWGIEYLLAEWAGSADPYLNESTINQLNNMAKTELHRRYLENELPDPVINFINTNKTKSESEEEDIKAIELTLNQWRQEPHKFGGSMIQVVNLINKSGENINKAIESSFNQWRQEPRKFEDSMTLIELLPEYTKAAQNLREKQRTQLDIHNSLSAARTIGFIAKTQQKQSANHDTPSISTSLATFPS